MHSPPQIEDYEGLSNVEESESNNSQRGKSTYTDTSNEILSPERSNRVIDVPSDVEGTAESQDLEDPLASFPIKPLKALKGYFDFNEDNIQETSKIEDPVHSGNKQQFQANQSVKTDSVNINPTEDSSEGLVVQRKGRFKVTSGDVSPKDSGTSICNSGSSNSPTGASVSAAAVSSSLQYLLQLNAMQKEEIIKLSKYMEQMSGKQAENPEAGTSEISQQPSSVSSREKELMSQVIQLQQSIGSIKEELQKQRLRNMQLETQFKYLSIRE